MTEVINGVVPAGPRRFKLYPAYKDSGVDWLGDIPAHWVARRLKYVAPISDERAFESSDLPYVGLEHVESWTGRLVHSENGTDEAAEAEGVASIFRPGDVLFGKLRPYLAKVLRPDFEGRCSTELLVLRANGVIEPFFLAYALLSRDFIALINAMTYGAKMPRANPDRVMSQRVPLPPLAEQRAIAAFLDRETAEIDALVAEKERLIALLQEQRSALITRAVTRGLDPNVPMKDSGVEWLGGIPAHWEVSKLKHVCDRVFVGIAEAATFAYVDDGVPMLRSTDVRANRIRTDDIRHIDREFASRLSSKRLKTGDIVTVRTGNAGVSAVVPSEYDGGQCFTLVVSRPAAGHDSHFFCFWLNAPTGQEQFQIEGMGTAQVNISVPIVQNTIVCVPPQNEQVGIARWIHDQLAWWDELAMTVRDGIDRLTELRSALISAAVTGEIDVREELA